MRARPSALGHVDEDQSGACTQWHRAQVARLARRLGYELLWATPESSLCLVDQARQSDVDAVILASCQHIDALTLDRLMHTCDVEIAVPRDTFARYLGGQQGWLA